MRHLCTVLLMCCAMNLLFLSSQSVYAQVENSRNGDKKRVDRKDAEERESGGDFYRVIIENNLFPSAGLAKTKPRSGIRIGRHMDWHARNNCKSPRDGTKIQPTLLCSPRGEGWRRNCQKHCSKSSKPQSLRCHCNPQSRVNTVSQRFKPFRRKIG